SEAPSNSAKFKLFILFGSKGIIVQAILPCILQNFRAVFSNKVSERLILQGVGPLLIRRNYFILRLCKLIFLIKAEPKTG
ncbi:hypothetical protein N9Y63_08460, partial [Akkermansiaceae bacterium]|nr:hypothetical protein [Akkermansiaceae bacterium]